MASLEPSGIQMEPSSQPLPSLNGGGAAPAHHQSSEHTGPLATREAPMQVAPEGAEELLTHAHLGKRIKQLRLKRSMGLVELGRRTGLSASFLSQLETGRVVPTLRNLARLALVFEKDLSYFFESNERRVFRVQRRKDRVRLSHGSPAPDYVSESFGILIPEGGLRPCLAELNPGDTARPFEPKSYAGTEMVYVLEGSVALERKGQMHRLQERDVMYISGETQRNYRCDGDSTARMLIISFDNDAGESPRIRRRPQPITS